jgi:crossover junction endodeoxyribonuclease RuvC
MRILGIDPGLGITGYAVVESLSFRETKVVEAGAIRPGRGTDLPARLRALHEDLSAIIAEFSPRRIAVEQVFVHRRHVRSAVQMGHARGVILLAAAAAQLDFDEFSPAEIKKSLTGHGQASKHQMQSAVMHACGLASLPEPADVADAIAIAFCGATRLHRPLAPRLVEADAATAREPSPRRRSSREDVLATLRLRGVTVPEEPERSR